MSNAPRLYIAPLGFAALLTFFASLCELILAGIVQHRRSYALSLVNEPPNYGWLPANGTNQSLPPYIWSDSSSFISTFSAREISSAVITLLFSLITIAWTILSIGPKSRTPPARSFSLTLCISAAVVILVNTGIIAWIFTVHHGSDTIYLFTPPPDPEQQTGLINNAVTDLGWGPTLDWEDYLCTIAPQVRQYDGGQWFATSCTYNVASRWTLVPVFALSLVTSILLWMAAGSYSTGPPSTVQVGQPIPRPPTEKQDVEAE